METYMLYHHGSIEVFLVYTDVLANIADLNIKYSKHQCHRSIHTPKISGHSLAVKRIARYLQAKNGVGIPIKYRLKLTIDCY